MSEENKKVDEHQKEENDNLEDLNKENSNENPSESDTPISDEDIILKLNEEISDLKDQRLRAIAELENFRKRAEKDQSDALKNLIQITK